MNVPATVSACGESVRPRIRGGACFVVGNFGPFWRKSASRRDIEPMMGAEAQATVNATTVRDIGFALNLIASRAMLAVGGTCRVDASPALIRGVAVGDGANPDAQITRASMMQI